MELPTTIEELEALQEQIRKKTEALKNNPEHKFIEGLHQILNTKNYAVPPQYVKYIDSIKDKKPGEIIKSIMDNDKLIHFPILMTLLQVWPCNKITLRERLIQLYDSYIFHSEEGYALAEIVKFPVDRILDACRDHDPALSLGLINDQLSTLYKLDMEKYNTGNNKNQATGWLNTAMSNLQFIAYVIDESDEKKANIFALSLNFMMKKIIAYDDYSVLIIPNRISNTTVSEAVGHYGIFNKLVDEANSNGSDYIFSKAILAAFKGVEFDKGLAV